MRVTTILAATITSISTGLPLLAKILAWPVLWLFFLMLYFWFVYTFCPAPRLEIFRIREKGDEFQTLGLGR